MSTNLYLQDDIAAEAGENHSQDTRHHDPLSPSYFLDDEAANQARGICITDSIQGRDSNNYVVSDTGNETPVEMQLEEVDMENEDMDMLEWLVRKIIPIPKEYYWETGNNDLPLRTKAWHQVVGSLSATIKLIDRMGKPIVDASGLKNSRFEYVRETMTEAQMQESIEKAQERKLEVQNSQRRHIPEEEI